MICDSGRAENRESTTCASGSPDRRRVLVAGRARHRNHAVGTATDTKDDDTTKRTGPNSRRSGYGRRGAVRGLMQSSRGIAAPHGAAPATVAWPGRQALSHQPAEVAKSDAIAASMSSHRHGRWLQDSQIFVEVKHRTAQTGGPQSIRRSQVAVFGWPATSGARAMSTSRRGALAPESGLLLWRDSSRIAVGRALDTKPPHGAPRIQQVILDHLQRKRLR